MQHHSFMAACAGGPLVGDQVPTLNFNRPAGLLVLHNASTAEWSWVRNEDRAAVAADRVVLLRTVGCSQQQAAAGEQQARPGAASGGGSSRGCPGPAVLALAAATAAVLQEA